MVLNRKTTTLLFRKGLFHQPYSFNGRLDLRQKTWSGDDLRIWGLYDANGDAVIHGLFFC